MTDLCSGQLNLGTFLISFSLKTLPNVLPGSENYPYTLIHLISLLVELLNLIPTGLKS